MTLTEQDAYALRRALSSMAVPSDLTTSPLVESLLAALDWEHNPAHRALLQQIVTHHPAVSAQLLRMDPTRDMPSNTEVPGETFVPPYRDPPSSATP